ncbi:MAG: hypothetical protein L6W00_04815 [Lentisphaeria bacterium]|nr:MAG: hypothetical protein L6W00_04815 [Lentisphaeria bacterium]
MNGGIFRKANGGEVALLWSQGPTGSVLLAAPVPELEAVSLYGESSTLKPVSSRAGVHTFLVPLTDRPLYLHAARAGMRLEASPVDAVKVLPLPDGKTRVTFTLLNRGSREWNARIKAPATSDFRSIPATATLRIAPKKRRNLSLSARAGPADAAAGVPPSVHGRTARRRRVPLFGFTPQPPVRAHRQPPLGTAEAEPGGTGGDRPAAETRLAAGGLLLGRPGGALRRSTAFL